MTARAQDAPQAGDAPRAEDTPHLIALDLDGTVVDYDGALLPEVRDTISELTECGHHPVICTGRALAGALEVANRLDQTSDYVICSNGAVVVRLDQSCEHGWEVLSVDTFDPRSALEAMASVLPTALFMVEDENLVRWASEDFPRGDLAAGEDLRIVGFEGLKDIRATRIVMRETKGSREDFQTAVERIGLHGVTYSIGWSNWLDIAPDGVSKASGIEKVADALGIDMAHTVAAGDGANDLAMLRAAGFSIAMGQAGPHVLEAADVIAPPVSEGGLATALRGHFGLDA